MTLQEKDEIKKEEKINLTIEFVDNGAIIEYPDDYMKCE